MLYKCILPLRLDELFGDVLAVFMTAWYRPIQRAQSNYLKWKATVVFPAHFIYKDRDTWGNSNDIKLLPQQMDLERLSNQSLGVKDRRHYKLFMHAYVSILNKRVKFLIIKPTRCTNFSKFYSWNETLHVSDSLSVHHQEFFTVHTAW
jgi:hypothetical protein